MPPVDLSDRDRPAMTGPLTTGTGNQAYIMSDFRDFKGN